MCGAPIRAQGEQRNRQFGNHWHVDGDAVALLHAESLQRIGAAADLVEQVLVGENTVSPGSPSK